MSKYIFAIFFLLCWGQSVVAQIDAMEFVMRQPYQNKQQQHWLNLVTNPYLLSSNAAVEFPDWQLKGVRLPTDKPYRILLPAYSSLRLYNPDQILDINAVKVFISNGTGLFAATPVRLTKDGHSLLLSPQSEKPLVVQIEHGLQQTNPLDLAVLISQRDSLPELAPYKNLIGFSADWAWVSQAPFLIPELYWQLDAQVEQEIQIQGPGRIAFKHRLNYQPETAKLLQDYRLRYRLDNGKAVWLDFSTSAQSRRYSLVNGLKKTLGRQQRAFIEIPAGEHRLRLMADREIYIQVVQQTENDYLLPKLNQPPVTVSTVRQQGELKAAELPQVEHDSNRKVRDNYYKSQVLDAYQHIKMAAHAQKDYPDALAAAESLRGQRSFYQHLLPATKHLSNKQFFAYFLNKTLGPLNQPPSTSILADQHLGEGLNRLPQGYFFPLADRLNADRYILPERNASTWLRLVVDKRHCSERIFFLQMDNMTPQELTLNCQIEAQLQENFSHTLAQSAIDALNTNAETIETVTLTHEFTGFKKPAPIIPVASYEFELPKQVKQLKLWTKVADSKPLNLAIQVRMGKVFQLSEQSYLARLHGLTKARLLALLINDDELSDDQSNISQLKNQWLPLTRFLSSLQRGYRASVAAKQPVNNLASAEQVDQWQHQALSAEQAQKWVVALQFWNQIVIASDGLTRDQAQFHQADILNRLSEHYLAQRLWRYLTLYGQPSVARQAKTRLLAIYQQQHDLTAKQTLAAAMFMQHPDQQGLSLLIQTLVENQQYHYALLLSHLCTKPPLNEILKAAYHQEWWQSYQRFVNELPENQQSFWLGLKAQKQGDYSRAIELWKNAGAIDWQQQLELGQEIRKQLAQGEDIHVLYRQWILWQQKHPGNRVWQDAGDLVYDAAGSDRYYALERDLYSQAFRATSDRPVRLQVMGPATLNIQFRLLHDDFDSQKDGWLTLKDNQQHYQYPFSNNTPVETISLIGAGNYLPGELTAFEHQLGEGLHELELYSNVAPVSISMSRQRPELPLTILAPLQWDTFNQALNYRQQTNIRQFKQHVPAQLSQSKAILMDSLNLTELEKSDQVDSAEQAEMMLMHCLAALEQQQPDILRLINAAEQLSQKFVDSKVVQSLWHRISRYSRWQPMHSIVKSAGISFVDTEGWQPVSPELRIRQALITPVQKQEHVIFSDQRLVMSMANLSTRNVQVEVKLDDIPFLPKVPARLRYQVDELTPKVIDFSNADGWKKFFIKVPAGEHQLRFFIDKPVGNQFIKLRIRDDVFSLPVSQERGFIVSTVKNPVQLYAKGPTSIRIDEWMDGEVTSRYQNVEDGWQLLTVLPSEQHTVSRYLFWQREPVEQLKPINLRKVKRIVKRVAEALPEPVSLQTKIVEEDDLTLPVQDHGTWSFSTKSVRRNNVQEDSGQAKPMQFQEFSLNHRYFNALQNAYWNTEGFVRAREHGGPTFGLSEELYMMPENFPFSVNLEAKAVTQIVDKDPEWLGQVKLALSRSAQITPKTSVVPKLSWFARYMSMRNDKRLNDQTFARILDQDIYTAYKSHHNTGLSASLLFRHDPWLDTRWTAKINTTSNENLNLFNPDFFSTEVHWLQLMGNLTLDASYRLNFYQRDKDRISSSKRHFGKMKLNWQAWTTKWNRLEIGAEYNYDIDNKAHLGMLSFNYHFAGHRGYRDFKPGEINFLPLKQRMRMDEIR